jgi:hypothetical protein
LLAGIGHIDKGKKNFLIANESEYESRLERSEGRRDKADGGEAGRGTRGCETRMD